MPRDLTKDRQAHEALSDAVRNAPKLNRKKPLKNRSDLERTLFWLRFIEGCTIALISIVAIICSIPYSIDYLGKIFK
jgi:hypothetical protein